jgi:cytochrome P450
MLLRAHDEDGTRLTDDELVGQTNFLFMAGHATTTSALTWTLFLISQHPHVAAALEDELAGTLRGRPPTVEDLQTLPLLEATIKESLRLLPPVLWWSRISTAPCTLGPYPLPPGARVVYSAYITHRIASLYPRPERFLPERWLEDDAGPFDYIPFSAGPRMCLGASFSMIEMKLILATLLPRFRLAPLPGSRVDHGGLMLSIPKPGLPMLLHRQDRRFTKTPVRGSIHTVVDLA